MLAKTARANHNIEEYTREYPSKKHAPVINTWLLEIGEGEFPFAGLIDPSDATVVSTQAVVYNGDNWFGVSDELGDMSVPSYAKFFSVFSYKVTEIQYFYTQDKAKRFWI
jgi:hypothetical protein